MNNITIEPGEHVNLTVLYQGKEYSFPRVQFVGRWGGYDSEQLVNFADDDASRAIHLDHADGIYNDGKLSHD